MVTVNLHEAKTQLSKLVDRAAKGEAFVIAKAGKPLVKIAPLNVPAATRRLGFLTGEIAVPRDFDRMGAAEILFPAVAAPESMRRRDTRR